MIKTKISNAHFVFNWTILQCEYHGINDYLNPLIWGIEVKPISSLVEIFGPPLLKLNIPMLTCPWIWVIFVTCKSTFGAFSEQMVVTLLEGIPYEPSTTTMYVFLSILHTLIQKNWEDPHQSYPRTCPSGW